LMDISEEVLFNTLAQLGKKELADANKKVRQEKTLEVVKKLESEEKEEVDIMYLLERKLIEILLLYGNYEERFEEHVLRANEHEEVETVQIQITRKVFDQVYLSLHEDEIEFTNSLFKAIYQDIIAYYHKFNTWNLEDYLTRLRPELSQEITSIIMEDEKESLHNWEVQNIIVKTKEEGVSQYVSETILTLRWYLVDKIVDGLKNSLLQNGTDNNSELLTNVMDYSRLSNFFSLRLGRVMSRFSK